MIDEHFEEMKKIQNSYGSQILNSEEDAKIKIINDILYNVLGWNKNDDVEYEKNVDKKFADYAISTGDVYKIALEAKKDKYIDLNVSNNESIYKFKIGGPKLSFLVKEIEQAFSYGSKLSAPISVLTDGGVWVIFKTYHEGVPYKDREAIIFPSLEAIVGNFDEFYSLLSKTSVENREYAKVFDTIYNSRISLSRNLYSAIDPDSIRIGSKSDLAYEVDNVFKAFFEKLTADKDEEMLIECFVDTKESRYADFAIEKIAQSVLGKVENANKDIDEGLLDAVQAALDNNDGETIFIVGPTGSGKSTFVKRFFSQTLRSDLRDNCIIIKLNFLDNSGDKEKLHSWLTGEIIKKIENELYDDGAPSWDELKGLYFTEYNKRRKGVDKLLYERDKEAFQIKFAAFVDSEVASDRQSYLNRMLWDVVHNRKKLPVFIIDNTDEFEISFKEIVFQYFQSVRRNVSHTLIVFPITDKSAWSFNKTELANIYTSKSFFLPTPPPREVFRKRIQFIRSKIEESSSADEGKSGSYFSKKGIRITLPDLNHFTSVVENVFVDHDSMSKLVGDISNYNIRKTLVLSNKIITSPEIDVDTLIKSYISGEFTAPKIGILTRALLRGKYTYYKLDSEQEIYPVFSESNTVAHSPLLAIRIMAFLEANSISAGSFEEQYITVNSILSYFEAIGSDEAGVLFVVKSMIDSQLLELFDPSFTAFSTSQKICLSSKGRAHFEMALSNRTFLAEMALTTPVIHEYVAKKIKRIFSSKNLISAKLTKVRAEFVRYLIERDADFLQQDSGHQQYLNQSDIFHRLTRLSGVGEEVEKQVKKVANRKIYSGVVEFYNEVKGYGFVKIPDIGVDAYLSSSVLASAKIGSVYDGVELQVKIDQGSKGLSVTEVVGEAETKLNTINVKVDRLFPRRGYGFALDEKGDSVFLHYSSLPKEVLQDLNEGDELLVRVGVDGDARKRIVNFVEFKN